MILNITSYCLTTNSVFLTGICKWAPAPYRTPTCTLFYNGDTLDLAQCDGFWLRLDMDDLRLLSMGKVRPDSRYEHGGEALWIRTTTQNNRVFGQTIFTGGIVFGDSTLLGQRDHAFLVWGYDGNELFGTNFHHCGTTTLVDSPHVIDSIVYLAGTFDRNSTFGTIAVPSSGASYAYIAKYVDTSFMTPYVVRDSTNPPDTGDVRILLADVDHFVTYPNPFRQRVHIKVGDGQLKEHNGTATAILTDLMGRREEVRLTSDGPGQYTLDLTARPQSSYLLTLTTADGNQHTVKLLKQSDVFSR